MCIGLDSLAQHQLSITQDEVRWSYCGLPEISVRDRKLEELALNLLKIQYIAYSGVLDSIHEFFVGSDIGNLKLPKILASRIDTLGS